jgi:hypothetical protein
MQHANEFVIDKFQDHDVIFLGENHAIKENVDFVVNLIPDLAKHGVLLLGMEFGAVEDQAKLDTLVTAKAFDDQLARDLLYSYNVAFPYQEYMNIYRAVHQVNQTSKVPMRVLNLSYRYDWHEYKPPYTPIKKRRVFHRGDVDHFRFQVIKEEVLAQKAKILVLTGTPHALTRYQFIYKSNDWLGQLVYQAAKKRVYTIALHEFERSLNGEYQPLDQYALESRFVQAGYPIGVDLHTDPIGDVETFSKYAEGYNKLRLQDVFDGYIVVARLYDRHGCTIDYDFLSGKEYADVLLHFPDPDWHVVPQNEEEYWRFVENYVDLTTRQIGYL